MDVDMDIYFCIAFSSETIPISEALFIRSGVLSMVHDVFTSRLLRWLQFEKPSGLTSGYGFRAFSIRSLGEHPLLIKLGIRYCFIHRRHFYYSCAFLFIYFLLLLLLFCCLGKLKIYRAILQSSHLPPRPTYQTMWTLMRDLNACASPRLVFVWMYNQLTRCQWRIERVICRGLSCTIYTTTYRMN